jgi:hypothetical protein
MKPILHLRASECAGKWSASKANVDLMMAINEGEQIVNGAGDPR